MRRRPNSDDEGDGPDKNEGRLHQEFEEIQVIGKGQFSTVFKAKNRVDKHLYAVKKMIQLSRGAQSSLKEVFALANVSIEAAACTQIVRYYSSWIEDGRIHIQTELCEGSLRDRLVDRRKKDPANAKFQEPAILEVIRDVAEGLRVLHGCGFVHLDIKPDNILVSRGQGQGTCIYKIADLGLASAAMGTGCDDISEGDCRYLAKEVLRGILNNLPKADVFSLGLVLYELTINPKPLPCNGPEWQQLREARLETSYMAPLSEPLMSLIHRMVHPEPEERPPCEDITRHPTVAPTDKIKEENQRLQAEVARKTQQADEYWHEMMLMKRQELLSGAQPCRNAAAALATSARPLQLRRGRTVG